MAKTATKFLNTREVLGAAHFPLFSWRAVIAALFFSLICYATLTALGVAVAGASVDDMVRGQTEGANFAAGLGVWSILSIIASVFVGAYFAARTSNVLTKKIGIAQGIVVASVFLSFLIYGASSTIGAIGNTVGLATKSAGGGVGNLVSNDTVQNVLQESLADLNIKTPPEELAKGVMSRVMKGDEEGVKNYIAAQAGVPRAQIEARIDEAQKNLKAKMNEAAEAASKGIQAAGWAAFLILAIGLASGIMGGIFGARANNTRPLVTELENPDVVLRVG